ncbi:S-type pyocin domain-containing protein [Pseudomonas cremoricolorata]|uniref:S-type pyocin domain-containing protein n=1 Tax=Pseudomonas cremoricolorata TaxID=157783 RepID=UPI000412DB75|nr:S-type pyocin domain-containing protein [Pseudomonas cremoricolorata]
MQHPPVELPPLEIKDLQLDYPMPPLFPFNLPMWPNNLLPPHFPVPPELLPAPEPTTVEIENAIKNETRTGKIPKFADVDAEIDSYAQLKSSTKSTEVRRQEASDELFLRTYNEMQRQETLAKALLGHDPLSKSGSMNVSRYEELYGDIGLDKDAFKSRLRESYAAAWARGDLAYKSYLLFFRAWNIDPSHQFMQVGPGVTPDAIRIRVRDRLAAESVAQAEAERIAAEAAAQAEAERIAAEAAAQAEAERIAAEAAAQAEAERIAAEAAAQAKRLANTYRVPTAPIKAGVAVITPAGLVVSAVTSTAMRAAVSGAVALVVANPLVAAGVVLGVAAFVYTSRLGDGKTPERYALQLPASDLLLGAESSSQPLRPGSTVDLPYRIGSRSSAEGGSEIFVAKTDNLNAPSAVRVIEAVFDAALGVYTAVTADSPPRTLTWTPAVSPGDPSTITPEIEPEPPVYPGATITPIDLRIDSFPELPDTSFDDYIVVFPADSGLAPIYTMFKSRREEPGVATGGSVVSTGNWIEAAATELGASIPLSVAETLRGKSFGSFRAFRRAVWKAMEQDSEVSGRFGNKRFGHRAGSSPFTREAEQVGGRKRYEIHHLTPIHSGGEVYDMDNLRIMTPRQHIQAHKQKANVDE